MGQAPTLWTPGRATDKVEVNQLPRKSVPTIGKKDGGSYFDDEMDDEHKVALAYRKQVEDLLIHLNARPDHTVYVGSTTDRSNIREVFNWWVREGALRSHPNIRIDYGVADGAIRVGE